jgi:hypothetical protein
LWNKTLLISESAVGYDIVDGNLFCFGGIYPFGDFVDRHIVGDYYCGRIIA